ncbi:hypothetical protein G6F70_003606 [Rhizopus microsporus]|nr:hypothetical protein G6F71_001238 [Rhizopus microsporus]KAG1200935.1 hypothetical protein G6F70_003606 [Rhizopus microsporus]KAG1212853.1 hypothetical protein G6F69_003335 [Rhizopus microsporus]KAG1234827.1 hypothetical protein G6F67_003230 [Rhizopus microsporus]KAG1267070.1 hypothetical protein G6F68_002231 [Rhizopus microsporus]
MNVSDLTQEQIVELLELSRSRKLERDRREKTSCPLPEEILEDMEDIPKTELKANIKNLDVHTVVVYKYEDAEQLRTVGEAAAEIFQDLKFIINQEGSEEDFQQLSEILEKVRCLSVYSYVSAYNMDISANKVISIISFYSSKSVLDEELVCSCVALVPLERNV